METIGYTYKGKFHCAPHAFIGIGEEYPTMGFTSARDREGNEVRMISAWDNQARHSKRTCHECKAEAALRRATKKLQLKGIPEKEGA